MGDHFTNTFLSAITRNDVWLGGFQDGNKWAWSDSSIWKYSLWASGVIINIHYFEFLVSLTVSFIYIVFRPTR